MLTLKRVCIHSDGLAVSPYNARCKSGCNSENRLRMWGVNYAPEERVGFLEKPSTKNNYKKKEPVFRNLSQIDDRK